MVLARIVAQRNRPGVIAILESRLKRLLFDQSLCSQNFNVCLLSQRAPNQVRELTLIQFQLLADQVLGKILVSVRPFGTDDNYTFMLEPR